MLKTGDTVKVHYTGKYLDDKVFDSTVASEPIIFTIGDEMMIPAFEDAVMSMEVGDKKTIVLKSDDAYGEYDEELLVEVNRKDVFGAKEVKIGDIIQAPTDDGAMVFKVHQVGDTTVVLDGNLEMAGKDVKFDIELISIIDASSADLLNDEDFDEEIEFEDDFDIEEY